MTPGIRAVWHLLAPTPAQTRTQAFNLTGGVLITLPEDRLFDEMEQLVLSTKHLQGLIDDFVLRQPPRRVLKVGAGAVGD